MNETIEEAEKIARQHGWKSVTEVAETLREPDSDYLLVRMLNLIVHQTNHHTLDELDAAGTIFWFERKDGRNHLRWSFPPDAGLLTGADMLRIVAVRKALVNWLADEWLIGGAHTFVNFQQCEWSTSTDWNLLLEEYPEMRTGFAPSLVQQMALCRRISVEAHAGQMRRGGEDYFENHVVLVAAYFLDDPVLYCTAVLHDTIEDNKAFTPEVLRERGVDAFIVENVVAITKLPGEDYDTYLARVMSNFAAWRVKIRDVLLNIGDNPTRKQVLKYAKALQVLLANAPASWKPS